MIDPVVQSIRVAVALNDRFAVLIEGPTTARVGEFSLSSNPAADELELRIGEAQRTYPEIWRHLDEARAGLAHRGVATDRFDALRAKQGQVQLGVSQIDVESQVSLGLRDVVETTKSATFNADGHRLARDACDALMAAMPDVDWQGIARAEAEQTAAAMAVLGASRQRMKLIIAAVIVALAFAAIAYA